MRLVRIVLAAVMIAATFAPTLSAAWDSPFPIFNDNGTGKRDQLQHLLYLAESGKTKADRGRKYRYLAEILIRVGRNQEAMRAYEAGALMGDGPSGSVMVKAIGAKRYKAHDLALLATISFMPHADGGSVNANLLMATLVSTGRLKGEAFRTSGYWIEQAANLGSGTAIRMLAEGAERRGNIKSAARLYASLDGKGNGLKRALRQAKTWYLGTHVKPNADLALAWLNVAAGIDAVAAGRLAGRLVRDVPDGPEQEALMALAAKAGVSNPTGKSSPSTRLAEAKTATERAAVLAALRLEAEGGNGSAAIVVWRAMVEDGAADADVAPYLILAARSGSVSAIRVAINALVRSPGSTPETEALLAVIDGVARAGNIEALKALGSIYATGGPVVPDAARSLEYFRVAADDGDLESQIRVGVYFAQTQADEAAIDLAREYLSLAAEQGSASAQAFLDALPV